MKFLKVALLATLVTLLAASRMEFAACPAGYHPATNLIYCCPAQTHLTLLNDTSWSCCEDGMPENLSFPQNVVSSTRDLKSQVLCSNVPLLATYFRPETTSKLSKRHDMIQTGGSVSDYAMVCGGDRWLSNQCAGPNFRYSCTSKGQIKKGGPLGHPSCDAYCECIDMNPKPPCIINYLGVTTCLRRREITEQPSNPVSLIEHFRGHSSYQSDEYNEQNRSPCNSNTSESSVDEKAMIQRRHYLKEESHGALPSDTDVCLLAADNCENSHGGLSSTDSAERAKETRLLEENFRDLAALRRNSQDFSQKSAATRLNPSYCIPFARRVILGWSMKPTKATQVNRVAQNVEAIKRDNANMPFAQDHQTNNVTTTTYDDLVEDTDTVQIKKGGRGGGNRGGGGAGGVAWAEGSAPAAVRFNNILLLSGTVVAIVLVFVFC